MANGVLSLMQKVAPLPTDRTRLAYWERRFKRLMEYAQHDDDCQSWTGEDAECTCGLDDIVRGDL